MVRKYLTLVLLAGSFLVAGCSENLYRDNYGYRNYRYNDPYYRDYRYGRSASERAYRAEQRRQERELRRIQRERQREYRRSHAYRY